jgi:hypothetical protein
MGTISDSCDGAPGTATLRSMRFRVPGQWRRRHDAPAGLPPRGLRAGAGAWGPLQPHRAEPLPPRLERPLRHARGEQGAAGAGGRRARGRLLLLALAPRPCARTAGLREPEPGLPDLAGRLPAPALPGAGAGRDQGSRARRRPVGRDGRADNPALPARGGPRPRVRVDGGTPAGAGGHGRAGGLGATSRAARYRPRDPAHGDLRARSQDRRTADPDRASGAGRRGPFPQTLEIARRLGADRTILAHIEEADGLTHDDLQGLAAHAGVEFAWDTLVV